jgi:hypothetical protein
LKRYANLDGDSGVLAYQADAAGIVVQFHSGERYEYTDESAGRAAIATMQRLAREGRGLSSFIARKRPPYARKLS